MRQRLSVLNLGVADLARSRQFYVDGLGLPARPESTERAFWIDMNKVWLGFFQRGGELAPVVRTGRPPGKPGVRAIPGNL